ncbi:lipopolysaccharide biosynthesis protein [Antrihabitans spumae]|uniref:Lipopolysaccharide biosynthesis protein n=1 Tax=Antrihabitans spumae TaxID=3373370 RepID=A0ABW7KMF3_9NOCA
MTPTEGPETGEKAGGATSGGLSGGLRRGAALSAIGLIAVQLTALIQTVVLAHLLTPVEVGIFTAGTVLTTFVVIFSHSTLSHALIQREGDIDDAAETVFWVTLATGVLLALAILACAPVAANVFDEPEVGLVTAVTAGTVLLTALMAVPDALMQRAFQFKRRIIVDPINAISFAVVSIVLAANDFGVWSLVIGYYVSLVLSVIAAWGLSGWRPLRGRFRFRLWRQMASFAFPLLIDSVIDRAVESLEVVIVGHRLDAAALGNYRYGRRLAFTPVMAIIQICSYVLFPAFSRIAGDAERFRAGFMRALTWMWFAVVPAVGLLAVIGEPAIVLLLGAQWHEAGTMVVTMSAAGLGVVLMSVTAEAMKGAGQPQRLYWMTGVGAVSAISLLLLLLPWRLSGVGVAISVSAVLTGLTGLAAARSVVGLHVGELVRCLLPPLVAACVAVAIVGPVQYFVLRAGEHGLIGGLGLVLAECVVFALIFLVLIRLLAPALLEPIVDAVRARTRRAGTADKPTESAESTTTE